MNIAEIRSQLNTRLASQGFGSFPSSAPDWVIERIHQKEKGLPLTPVPAGIRVLKNNAELRSFVAQTKPTRTTPVQPEVTASEREAAQRRVILASIALLQ
jgi:hypothetical protein